MKKTYLRRSLAAVATAVACLAIMGNPAAATTHDASLTAGEVTLTKTGMTPEVIDLAPGGTGSCGTGTLTVDETGTAVGVTALSASAVRTFGTTGTFLAVLSRSTTGNTNGTLNSTATPHTITNMRVAIVITIYNTTGCTPTGTPICTLAIILNLSGTSTSITTSNTFTLTGASVGNMVAFPTCATGPSYLIGSASTVTSAITGHITTN